MRLCRARMGLWGLFWMQWGTSERFHIERGMRTMTFCKDHSGVCEEVTVVAQVRDLDGLDWSRGSSDREKGMGWRDSKGPRIDGTCGYMWSERERGREEDIKDDIPVSWIGEWVVGYTSGIENIDRRVGLREGGEHKLSISYCEYLSRGVDSDTGYAALDFRGEGRVGEKAVGGGVPWRGPDV